MEENKKTYAQILVDRYIAEHLENATCLESDELGPYGVKTYFFDELDKQDIDGYPFATDFMDAEGNILGFADYKMLPKEERKNLRLRYHYLPKYHELYIGTTGSGKTTGCMEPQIRALAKQKNKPNLFVTDPKGEIFEHNARYLNKLGYRTFVLNFKDFSRSDRWNPLDEIYDAQMEYLECGKGMEERTGPIDESLELVSPRRRYGETYYVYEGKAFPDKTTYDHYISIRKGVLKSNVASLVNQISSIMIPSRNDQDPGWENGARSLCVGILLMMVNDIGKEDFTRGMMTLKTLNEIFSLFREGYDDNSDIKDKLDEMVDSYPKEVSDKLYITLHAHPSGRKGYLSTFQSSVTQWMQGHIHYITSGTTIDINGKEPYAVFISTRDYDKSDFPVAALFIDWAYRNALKAAEKAKRDERNDPMTRDLHLLLDEFGNIPKIPSFENKIATARSRKIWFHIFVQTYDQLENVYGKETAAIIIDNCNQQVFLGAQAENSKERFCKECGTHVIPTADSLVNRDVFNFAQVPVISISDLDKVGAGECYIKRLYIPAFHSHALPSYAIAEAGIFTDFHDDSAFIDIAPLNDVLPTDKEHTCTKFRITNFTD